MLPLESLTRRIIGLAFRVQNTLGPGFLEHVYRNALAHELRKAGLQVQVEAPLQVPYDGEIVGECCADIIVERSVIIEAKAQEAILPGHQAQLLAYLRCSGHPIGLVVNFSPVRVEVKRVIETKMAKTG